MEALRNNPSTAAVLAKIAAIIIGILFIIALGQAVVWSFGVRETDGNLKKIADQQITELEGRYGTLQQGKANLDEIIQSVPTEERLLINTNVQATRLTGYLGPQQNGVFVDEDAATRLALSSGSRCLVIEVGRQMNSQEPVLLYRDDWGFRRSLNAGSLSKVAKSIAARAFTAQNDGVPSRVANDPLFVVVQIASAPDSTSNAQEQVRFLARVAEQLQPLKDLLIGQTPQGDFHRQGLESQLFFMPTAMFNRRIVLLCNADTRPFRKLDQLGLQGEIGPKQDLDQMIHARLQSRQSPSGLGITTAPTTNTPIAAVITTPGQWLNTPSDRIAEAVEQTKAAWTLVMPPVAGPSSLLDEDKLKKLLTFYGVQAVPFCIFDEPKQTDLFLAKGKYQNTASWSAKAQNLRFVPPKPGVILKPSPQTNAQGGRIFSPGL